MKQQREIKSSKNQGTSKKAAARPSIDLRPLLTQLMPLGRGALEILGSALVTLFSIGVLLKLRSIGHHARTALSDGARVFSPGQLLSDQAFVGLVIAGISFVLIVIAGLLFHKRSATVTLTIVFAVISFGAATYAFATYQQFKGFLPLG